MREVMHWQALAAEHMASLTPPQSSPPRSLHLQQDSMNIETTGEFNAIQSTTGFNAIKDSTPYGQARRLLASLSQPPPPARNHENEPLGILIHPTHRPGNDSSWSSPHTIPRYSPLSSPPLTATWTNSGPTSDTQLDSSMTSPPSSPPLMSAPMNSGPTSQTHSVGASEQQHFWIEEAFPGGAAESMSEQQSFTLQKSKETSSFGIQLSSQNGTVFVKDIRAGTHHDSLQMLDRQLGRWTS